MKNSVVIKVNKYNLKYITPLKNFKTLLTKKRNFIYCKRIKKIKGKWVIPDAPKK